MHDQALVRSQWRRSKSSLVLRFDKDAQIGFEDARDRLVSLDHAVADLRQSQDLLELSKVDTQYYVST